jgi:hypothetical protein
MMKLLSEATTVGATSLAFEPCEAFRAAIEHDEPFCAGCGHLADDHPSGSASVTPLRRRAAQNHPAGRRRKAS